MLPRHTMKRGFDVIAAISRKQLFRALSTQLNEVGKLQNVKMNQNYQTGQLFIHRVFGYRGVILHPWVAKLHDHDGQREAREIEIGSEFLQLEEEEKRHSVKVVTAQLVPFYRTLIDGRDYRDGVAKFHRNSPEVVTLGDDDGMRLQVVQHDYVNHEDVIPYGTRDVNPIDHGAFDQMLQRNEAKETKYEASDLLDDWQAKRMRILDLSNVYRVTTENVRVTVMPMYIESWELYGNQHHLWSCVIRIENLGALPLVMKRRKFEVYSHLEKRHTEREDGVLGDQQVVLSRDLPVFQYTSNLSLQSDGGYVWGTFTMEKPCGSTFEAAIPSFALECKE